MMRSCSGVYSAKRLTHERRAQELLYSARRSSMRYRRMVLRILILILFTSVAGHGQTPASATNYYQHGINNFERGDLDGALEDYTRAIEISSRLFPAKRSPSRTPSSANAFDSAAADRITFIDPFTARAYTNRGVVLLRKGDVDGAISDFDRAIEINSGLAEAYLDRGVARRTKGDLKGARADFDRALLINPRFSEAY